MNFQWLWFEIVIIFINRILNLQGIKTFSKIDIYEKMINKKTCHLLGQLFSIKNCKKNCSKIDSHEKVFFWEKKHVIISKVIVLVHCISFAPIDS
jgi:hypothetical protein